MDCSIIICTRNRAPMLEATLRAFRLVKVPPDWEVEMIIVDNGSTDHTAELAKSVSLPGIEIRYVHEPRPGKSRAQNTAMVLARGVALLFTDDDVEPAENWLECMARPLLEGRCEAVTGRIRLADHLRRPWLRGMHLIWLADIQKPGHSDHGLVGASMGVHRSVFDQIDDFDEELGPGASGFGEETLLWLQMLEAGMRIEPVTGTHVVHHPDPSRLLRANWLEAARRFGRTKAYLMHHWEHVAVPFPRVQVFWHEMKLRLRGIRECHRCPQEEGCSEWEISYVARIEALRGFVEESRKPRKYERRALRRKKRHDPDTIHVPGD